MKLTVYREKKTGIFNSDLGCKAGKHRCDGSRGGQHLAWSWRGRDALQRMSLLCLPTETGRTFSPASLSMIFLVTCFDQQSMVKVKTKGRVTSTLRSQEVCSFCLHHLNLPPLLKKTCHISGILTARPSSLSLPSSELGCKPTYRPLQVCELAQGRPEKHPAKEIVHPCILLKLIYLAVLGLRCACRVLVSSCGMLRGATLAV